MEIIVFHRMEALIIATNSHFVYDVLASKYLALSNAHLFD